MNVESNVQPKWLRLDIFLYASLGMWFFVLSALGIFLMAKYLDEVETVEHGSAVVWLPTYGEAGDDGLTEGQLDEIQRTIAARLDTSLLVKEYNYIDKDESQAAIQQYFVDSPEIIDLLNDSDTVAPTSFVVFPKDEASLQEFGDYLNSLPAIDKVSVSPSEVTESENWPLIGALAIPLSLLVVIWLGFFILKPRKIQ